MKSPLSIRDVHRASQFFADEQSTSAEQSTSSNLEFNALRGRLTELSAHLGHAPLTQAVDLIAQAHQSYEPAAWLGTSHSFLYPPDTADWGLDWEALAVIRLKDAHRAGLGADKLLRSGGFGLVVIDLVGAEDRGLPDPLMGRLLRLAREHDSAVVFLTQRRPSISHSLSSLIALRARTQWEQADPARLCALSTILKDKYRGPGRTLREVYHGPMGLY